MTTVKEQLLQALDRAPDSVLEEALHYVQYLTDRHLDAIELREDLEAIRAARQERETEGTVSWEELKTEIGL
ncbi:MAG: hypothetical protein KME45_03080 [Stenomitos rutilans HA7619-LM2]|jgi:hypothetical protein|nr:hypothetical protein [Stenomitos rutilans HA7619-LM2]MBW4469368.1 hypothetical protein [Stenomitos rutilans HA7619-LM2]